MCCGPWPRCARQAQPLDGTGLRRHAPPQRHPQLTAAPSAGRLNRRLICSCRARGSPAQSPLPARIRLRPPWRDCRPLFTHARAFAINGVLYRPTVCCTARRTAHAAACTSMCTGRASIRTVVARCAMLWLCAHWAYRTSMRTGCASLRTVRASMRTGRSSMRTGCASTRTTVVPPCARPFRMRLDAQWAYLHAH